MIKSRDLSINFSKRFDRLKQSKNIFFLQREREYEYQKFGRDRLINASSSMNSPYEMPRSRIDAFKLWTLDLR